MAIAHGLIATPLFDGLNPASKESLAQAVPFPHQLGKPEEFTQLVLHVIENPYFNGTVIHLDAALRMQPK